MSLGSLIHFNPRSPWGERPGTSCGRSQSSGNFNPRSPQGERRVDAILCPQPIDISIHAPRKGSDDVWLIGSFSDPISIHAPHKGSDLPHRSQVCRKAISIHAPRKGSDCRFRRIFVSPDTDFNPRSPQGERLYCSEHGMEACIFQSTLPARGATFPLSYTFVPAHKFQSTLPARGATSLKNGVVQGIRNFNPRSPQGERQIHFLLSFLVILISIHAPRKGSDHCETFQGVGISYFNPRSPQGERPAPAVRLHREHSISIHAPRKGSDASIMIFVYAKHDFNPRSPQGERPKRRELR